MRFSAAAPLSSLVSSHLLPERLARPWSVMEDDQLEVTMIQMHNVILTNKLALAAYNLADVTCDFFKRGATLVRFQGSRTHCQVIADTGMSDDQLRQFADPNGVSYRAEDNVGMLPWPKR